MQGPSTALARRRRLIAFAIVSAAVATIAAAASLCRVDLLPPRLELRQLQQGAAVAHATIQLPPGQRPLSQTAFESQTKRTNLIGNAMSSPPVLERIGRAIGVDPGLIVATAEVNENVPVAFNEPDGERRATQIVASHAPYKLDVQTRPTAPLLDVYAQAPSVEQARRLADAAVPATNAYVEELALSRERGRPSPVGLEQLGAARGGPLDPSAPLKIAGLTFVVVFAIAFGLLFLLAQVRRGWLRAGRLGPGGALEAEPLAPPRPSRDSWPHTTRALPWMLAAFLVMLWLVPINAISIQASLPIDLKLDRLALPILVFTWLLALAAGGRGAPRWRFTAVHAAIALFVAVAFLSVVLNAAYLNQTLELELAIKKLTLLAAFFSVFLVVASAVRPTEVRPLMTLMLACAVICALGVLWEYRFGANLFYAWSDKLLPSFFDVAPVDTTGYDEIGRRQVIGPADLGLEAVAMLTMALPIAFVRVMHSPRSRERLLCGLAICILLGAMIATYRKSALLAPLTVCLILAYFRRRELLRLAPLGVVILLAIPALAPNALGSIVDQFRPNQLGVSTVSDRVSDYDAIRPDLLSHLAFGRGFGSYDHSSYRILDNDLLVRVVETGLVGLVAFVLMIGLIVAIAAPIVRGRDPSWGPPALAVAAAAGGFLVLSILFDLMSFPHAPYLFLVLAGFLAAILQGDRVRPAQQGPAAPGQLPDPTHPVAAPAERHRLPAPV